MVCAIAGKESLILLLLTKLVLRMRKSLLSPGTFYGKIVPMGSETTRQFLARLWELQAEADLKNVELAAILGCSPSHVSHMKAGRKGKQIGLAIALAAVRRFPELEVFLLAELPARNDNVPPGNEAEEQGS